MEVLRKYPQLTDMAGKKCKSQWCMVCRTIKCSTFQLLIDTGTRVYSTSNKGETRWWPQKKWVNICMDCFDTCYT